LQHGARANDCRRGRQAAKPWRDHSTADRQFRPDRYQEALQQLIEAKTKVLTIKPRAVSTPPPVIDLMAACPKTQSGAEITYLGAGGDQNESH
jgi:hypothetical protein